MFHHLTVCSAMLKGRKEDFLGFLPVSSIPYDMLKEMKGMIHGMASD